MPPIHLLRSLLARHRDRGQTPKERPARPTKSGHAPRLSTADRVSIEAAIAEHTTWSARLNARLDHPVAPAAQPLPDASQCGLGQWLAHAGGGPLRGHPLLNELEQEHQRFHLLSDQAVALADHGLAHLASTLLNTEFERSRSRVLHLLCQLQDA